MPSPRLRVVEEGDGHPCIAICPVGVEWIRATLPPRLGQSLRLALMEPRGSGSAGADFADASVTSVIEDVESTRARLGVDRVVVFGHSMNGLLALATAAAMADRVAGVITAGTPPRMPLDWNALAVQFEAEASEERRQAFAARAADAARAEPGSAEQRRLSAFADAARRWHDLSFDPTELDALMVGNLVWVQRVVGSMATQDWPSILESVRCPVFLGLGASDFVVPPSLWDDELDHLANVDVRVFERSGHTPFYEEPAEFSAAVEEWLAAELG